MIDFADSSIRIKLYSLLIQAINGHTSCSMQNSLAGAALNLIVVKNRFRTAMHGISSHLAVSQSAILAEDDIVLKNGDEKANHRNSECNCFGSYYFLSRVLQNSIDGNES